MPDPGQMKIGFYFRADNEPALYWADKIRSFIGKKNPGTRFTNKDPQILLVLGGDGTILEAVNKYHHLSNPLILGFNLGTVGFLASVREPIDFLPALVKFFKKRYSVVERMMLLISVERNGKDIFSSEALNEAVIQNPLGMVDIEALGNGTVIKKVRGSGVLVATATGSTAYNLSAHGPVVMPGIKCIILTELMAHDVPSPSIIFKYNQEIKFKVKNFRQRGLITVNKSKADVILITDGGEPFPLQEGDIVKIKSSPHLVRFIELENNYFFKSLKEKFSIK